MNSKRALVLTNHLHDYAGSEVLSLEVAETLAEMGFEVRIHCNSHDPGIRSINPSIPVSDSDQFPDIFDYDFVWSQHLLIPIAVSQHGLRRTHRTRIVSAHLSPFEPFEMTGLKSALILGASIAATASSGTASGASDCSRWGSTTARFTISTTPAPTATGLITPDRSPPPAAYCGSPTTSRRKYPERSNC